MLFLPVILLSSSCFAHSWVECTKYTGDLGTFEKDKCEGLPRPLGGNRNVGNLFGQDIGMDYRPPTNGQSPCQGNARNGLGANYPNGVIEYKAGETITLAWPAKNHAAAACTNANIPDEFLKLFLVPYDETAGDPTQTAFRQNQISASFSDEPHQNGVIDLKGFQNCPNFCDGTDKALCTGTFVVPTNVDVNQVYTLQWYWAFNGPADLYATCWEARIVAGDNNNNNGGGSPTLAPKPVTCTDCCVSDSIVAPGTGEMALYENIQEGSSAFVKCPGVYVGEFKLLCFEGEVRIVDGFCVADSFCECDSKNESDSSVVWLSLILALVSITFLLYLANDFGLIEMPWNSEEKPQPVWVEQKPRFRAKSVKTQSQTVLPVLPMAPSDNWYYQSVNGDAVGPLTERNFADYVKQKGVMNLQNMLVWNGETVMDWTKLLEVPGLTEQLNATVHSKI